ncbi:MAG: RNA methyltransferase, partial [Candidatus Binatia bacterium]
MLNNIRIILVRPRGSGNIGSVSRAMKNFGGGELAIVGSAHTQSFWAKAMAVHGRDILSEAKFYDTIRAAIAGCTLVIGTTCRQGLYRAHSQAPREVAQTVAAATKHGKVALIFGPEDHGLSNKDLEHCQLLLDIPSDPGYRSLNVAQAAVVCLYEFYVAALETTAD